MEDKRRILERLKAGEISIDEAEQLLFGREKKELSPDIDFASGMTDENNPTDTQSGESAKEKILDFIDQAVKKIKELDVDNAVKKLKELDVDRLVKKLKEVDLEGAVKIFKDLDLKFYPSVEVAHSLQQNKSDFETVHVDIANGSVHLVGWDHEDVRVEIHARVYGAETEEEGKAKLLENIELDWEGRELFLRSKDKLIKMNAKIYLPERQYQKVSVKMLNGPITVGEIRADEIEGKTLNGKLSISGCAGKEARLESGNGSMKISDSRFVYLETETLNGKVDLEGNYETAKAQTVGGSIFCTAGERTKKLELETIAGSVYIKVPEGKQVSGLLKSNVGTLRVDLEQAKITDEKSDLVAKTLRFESAGTAGDPLELHAVARTGSVFVQPLSL